MSLSWNLPLSARYSSARAAHVPWVIFSSLVFCISKRLFLFPLVLIQIFPKAPYIHSFPLRFPALSSIRKRASQFILKVIVPSPILFIRSHVPIPEVFWLWLSLCLLQKGYIILSGQIQSIGTAWLFLGTPYRSLPLKKSPCLQSSLPSHAFCKFLPGVLSPLYLAFLPVSAASYSAFSRFVDCTIDILLLLIPAFSRMFVKLPLFIISIPLFLISSFTYHLVQVIVLMRLFPSCFSFPDTVSKGIITILGLYPVLKCYNKVVTQKWLRNKI